VDPLLPLRLVALCGAGVGAGEKTGAPVFCPGPDLCHQLLASCELALVVDYSVCNRAPSCYSRLRSLRCGFGGAAPLLLACCNLYAAVLSALRLITPGT